MQVPDLDVAVAQLSEEEFLQQEPAGETLQQKIDRLKKLRRLKLQEELNVNKRFYAYRHNPVGFIEDVLGEEPWSKQVEICNSVIKNKYTSVRSCHDSGKSYIASRLVCWWLSVHPVGEAFAVTTAPTGPQIKAIMWREIHQAHARGGLDGRLNLTEWYIGELLVAMGRKPADYDAEAFQGIHAPYVLVVIDEGSGVERTLFDAVETITTTDDCRIVTIGNPDDPASYFAETHKKPQLGWNPIKISAFDTPNFTGEKVNPNVSRSLLSPAWVKDKETKWGVDSPLYISKVMAEFPDQSEDNVLSLGSIQAAQRRESPAGVPIILSVDVARMGNDSTVIALREGNRVRIIRTHVHKDTMETTGHVVRAFQEFRADAIHVDMVGVGGGVVDRLNELGYPVVGLEGSRAPDGGPEKDVEKNQRRYLNARSQWYWEFRQRLIDEHCDLDLDDDEEMRDQMANIKYRVNSHGKIVIESKDDIKKRGLPSPDKADAVIMAFARPQEAKKRGRFRGAKKW